MKKETVRNVSVGLLNLLVGLPLLLLEGYVLMLAVGVVRGEWLPGLPTIGYTTAVLLAAIGSLVVAVFRVHPALAKAIRDTAKGAQK